MGTVQKRISRLTGQLRGIQKMIEDERGVVEILQQIAAVKKAINGLTREILTNLLAEELPAKKRSELNELLKRAIDL
ncbi:MAG: metal-sensitive transcriptional regulator [Patescibacteria group bacterium]|nr:metal-sensitive transcriptional regulator [Patescibacteria group bacterium]